MYNSARHMTKYAYNICFLFFYRAEGGFEKIFAEADQKKFTSTLLQAYRDRNVSPLFQSVCKIGTLTSRCLFLAAEVACNYAELTDSCTLAALA